MRTRNYFKIGRMALNFNLAMYMLPKTKTSGLYNRVPKTPYKVLFMDYDRGMRLEWIEEEIEYFQKKFKLGDFIILESSPKSNSYHVICFDYLTPREENNIMLLSNCDDLFKQSNAYDYKSRVLRTFPKGKTSEPNFLKLIKSKYNGHRKKSLGHIKYYSFLFDIEGINKKNSIDTGVDLIEYITKKNV